MPTLRSPKTFTGPDLDVPSQTYEAWHTARYAAADWDALDLIRREDWAAYLAWVRTLTDAPVNNGVDLVGIEPAGDLPAARVREGGTERTIHTRRIVLATGQDSTGGWTLPPVVAALPERLRPHG